MKNRIFAMLFLSAALALPLFAQAPTAGSGAQPSAKNVDTICTDPLQPASHEGFSAQGEEPNLGNLTAHGFYRKNDVQKQISPIKTCLDELSAAAASQTTAIKDADLKAQQIVALASAKSNEADQHAIDAGNRAQAAQQAATQASTRIATVEQLVGATGQYQGGTETEIQFRPGQSVLSKSAKDALDQLAEPLKDRGNYVIEVRGFSPSHGQAAIADSRKMADSVAHYLILTHQIPVHRIYVLGMGNTPIAAKDGSTGKQKGGARVEISLLTNDLTGPEQH